MEARRCKCGYDRTHKLVKAEPSYGPWGWFLLVMGSTPRPKLVTLICSECGTSFGTSTEPDDLARAIK